MHYENDKYFSKEKGKNILIYFLGAYSMKIVIIS
jgi:hypothetical protein